MCPASFFTKRAALSKIRDIIAVGKKNQTTQYEEHRSRRQPTRFDNEKYDVAAYPKCRENIIEQTALAKGLRVRFQQHIPEYADPIYRTLFLTSCDPCSIPCCVLKSGTRKSGLLQSGNIREQTEQSQKTHDKECDQRSKYQLVVFPDSVDPHVQYGCISIQRRVKKVRYQLTSSKIRLRPCQSNPLTSQINRSVLSLKTLLRAIISFDRQLLVDDFQLGKLAIWTNFERQS